MARDKVLQTTRIHYSTALQDGSPLARQIVAPVLELLRQMAADIDTLRAGAVLVIEGEVELRAGWNEGYAALVLERELTDEQLEAPVIMVQAPGRRIEDLEIDGLVWFAARVKNAREIEVSWRSSAPAPRSVRVNCIIGTLEP